MSGLAVRFVRRLATAPGFRRLTRVRPLLRLSFALRASLVRERLRFARNELRRRPVTCVYRLRGSGVAVVLRHHTGDIMVLDEIFSQREYEPPPRAALALAALPSAPRVLDLGANIGLFGAWVLGRFPGAAIDAVEADPENAAVHRRTIAANGLEGRWRLVEAFAATAPGVRRFAGGEHATSHEAVANERWIDVRAVDVLPELAEADFVKIDIEGAEWDLLADPRFGRLRPRVVVLEYHEDGSPPEDPRQAAERALRAAGLDVVHAATKPQLGAGIVWGLLRTDAAPEHDSDRVSEDA
jgi:FkbM family methyltransferase